MVLVSLERLTYVGRYSLDNKTFIIRPLAATTCKAVIPVKHFADRLTEAITRTGNGVCVGLDPRWSNLPESLRRGVDESLIGIAEAYRRFCQQVIDVVAPLVPIVKVQAAFFEELGPSGMSSMA